MFEQIVDRTEGVAEAVDHQSVRRRFEQVLDDVRHHAVAVDRIDLTQQDILAWSSPSLTFV